jgi:hypothetical protein
MGAAIGDILGLAAGSRMASIDKLMPGGEPAVVLAVSVLIGSIGFKLVGDGIAVLF